MHQAHDALDGSGDAGTTAQELIEQVRAEVDRLSDLDPADVVEPAAVVADLLSRLLEEVER